MSAYLTAGVIAVTAVAVRWGLHPWLGDHLPLVTLFPAVAAVVWRSGPLPAIAATATGYVLSDLLFIAPAAVPARAAGLAVYSVSCGLLVWFGHALHRATRRAREGESLLLVTLASIGDAVLATDTRGCVTYLNRVAESLTGWTLKDAAGRPLDEVFRIVNEKTRLPVENPVTRALREGVTVGLANHTVLISRDGTERPIDDSAAPIKDDAGRVSGCVLVFRDVTERRRAELALSRSERELADFFDNASVGLHWTDADGRIVRVNQAELDLLGRTRDEVVGRAAAEFHVDGTLAREYGRRLAAGESLKDAPAQIRRSGGRVRDVLLHSSPLFEDGRFVRSRTFVQDVTDRKRAEATRALLAGIVAASDDAIVSKALDGTIQSWNASAERLFGFTADEAIGQSINLIVPPELRDEERRILERLRGGGRVDHFETVRVAKDGRQLDVSLSISPLFDDSGNVVGASKVARDIGERKRAERALRESEERFARFMQHLPGLAWIKDLDGRYMFANDAALRAFGKSRDALYGRTDDEVFAPDVAAQFKQNDLRALELGSIQMVETLWHPDGVLHHSIVSKFPITGEDGRFMLVAGVAIDITERKRAEDALQEADRRKDEFLAVLAHELRNPLAPISNSLEILRRSAGDKALVLQARETMERQLTQLVRLVDDLLDVSRITRDKLELRKTRVALQSVITQAVETCRPLIDRARQRLEVEVPEAPVYLDADPSRLTQVFSNLLDNASKFTPSQGRIALRAVQNDGQVEVSVKDSGIGIPADQLTTVFDMFKQVAHPSKRGEGGLGIGLTLVRRLVELHGGTVLAGSEGPGRGSEFVVRLPLGVGDTSAPGAAGRGRELPQMRALSVLVVDDNSDSAESLALLLSLSGHRTMVVQDGIAAVEAAERSRPDVVLLDLGLPRIDGFEVCRRIRAQAGGRQMTIVALTGWGQDEDRRKTREAGFDAHLVKPVDYDALMHLLATDVARGSAGT